MRHTVKEGEDMKWKDVARTTAITLGPLAVLVALLEVRLASGMSPWDIRVTCVLAVITGMWMVHAILLWGPQSTPPPETPEPTVVPDAPASPLQALLKSLGGGDGALGIPIFQVGSDEECDCGQVHGGEPMVMIPLPDGSCVVAHRDKNKDTGECTWAEHVDNSDQAQSAARLHEEFQCVRRRANR